MNISYTLGRGIHASRNETLNVIQVSQDAFRIVCIHRSILVTFNPARVRLNRDPSFVAVVAQNPRFLQVLLFVGEGRCYATRTNVIICSIAYLSLINGWS